MTRLYLRIFSSIIVLTIILLWMVLPALAQTHYAEMILTETAGTTYTMLPVRTPMPTTYLAGQNFMTATGLDTRVTDGTAYPHMLADDKLLFAFALPANTSNPIRFTTGNAALGAFDIIVGQGGSIAVVDAAALEPGAIFDIQTSGFVDTSYLANKNIVLKPGGLRVYVSAATTISAHIVGWTTPTGDNDPGGVWAADGNAWDDNTATFASCPVPGTAWSGWLELTHAAMNCDGLRYWVSVGHVDVNQIEIEMFYGGVWNPVYVGAFTSGAWQYLAHLADAVSNIHIRFYNANALAQNAFIHEVDYGNRTLTVSAGGVASNPHIVRVTADGAELKLFIDAVERASIAMVGGAVTDTPNNWTIDQANVMPYMDYYRQSVGGVPIVRYEPVTYILTTVLPDREGVAQNGTITWGTNPTGVGLLMEHLVPYTGYEAEAGFVETPDVLGDVLMPEGMFRPEAEMEGAWPIFGGFMENIADMTETPLSMFWWYLNGLLMLIVMAMVHRNLQNLWITGLAACVMVGLGIAMASFPEWFLVIAVLAAVGLATMERSPSL